MTTKPRKKRVVSKKERTQLSGNSGSLRETLAFETEKLRLQLLLTGLAFIIGSLLLGIGLIGLVR